MFTFKQFFLLNFHCLTYSASSESKSNQAMLKEPVLLTFFVGSYPCPVGSVCGARMSCNEILEQSPLKLKQISFLPNDIVFVFVHVFHFCYFLDFEEIKYNISKNEKQ